MSSRDLAAAVGMNLASVHYHCPTKDDLARAMVIRCRQSLERVREEIERKEGSAKGAAEGELRRFFGVLVEAFGGNDRVCLAAAVTAERDLVESGVVEALVRF